MNNSSKKFMRKINFPRRLCFLPVKSHIRKSTKMRFPGYPPKVVQLHNNRKSSEMVVQGWYITHFDRRDILNTQKICLGGFRNLSDLQRSIHEFLGNFDRGTESPKIECLNFGPRNFFSKIVFM